uniref:Transmembrane protein n=1 Tax=Helianthus annuus TaxID=4232 RepID=A0A251RMD8_HELAN
MGMKGHPQNNGTGGGSSGGGGWMMKNKMAMVAVVILMGVIGVMVVQKVKDRRLFNLVIKDKDRQIFSLNLLLQVKGKTICKRKQKEESRFECKVILP